MNAFTLLYNIYFLTDSHFDRLYFIPFIDYIFHSLPLFLLYFHSIFTNIHIIYTYFTQKALLNKN